ncbi:MAG: maleylpyruvate isomerase family mycothiol-dependent enzyme [Aeromicrobium sp.]|uniref:maleylpyruvate isomerase family mycothiol-dependent enzyme n=1 Tax=Aeromicrobium sp. TaxID=1871063 RepID=UPI0039E605B2
MSAAELHRSTAARFTEVVAGVTERDVPAPVDGWTARDVVGHLVEWFPVFLAAGGVELAPGPSVADDPQGAWSHQVEQVQELLDGPDAEFTHPHVGTMPLHQAVDRFYIADVFMHTWDLARANGQEPGLDRRLPAGPPRRLHRPRPLSVIVLARFADLSTVSHAWNGG